MISDTLHYIRSFMKSQYKQEGNMKKAFPEGKAFIKIYSGQLYCMEAS